MKIIDITMVSVTIELDNDFPYFNDELYDVYLNDNKVLTDVKTNVCTVFDLIPDKEYELRISIEKDIYQFRTLKAKKVLNIESYLSDEYYQSNNKETVNVTTCFQKALNESKDSLLIISKGKYYLDPLFVKSDVTIFLKKGAVLLGDIDRNNYPILPEMIKIDNKEWVLSSWEGESKPNFASLLTIINENNITIVGEGVIDGNAENSDWWINHKIMRGGYRPHNLFIAHSCDIKVIGVTFANSPSWTIHPFYSQNLMFLNTVSTASYDSPNTDGLNPESCENVVIKGAMFNVGDDCIAIKSGKISMVKDYYKPCENIEICNCFMAHGHGAIVLGSEISSGVKNIKASKCIFKGTDRGLRIKTRRGRGDKCVVTDITFTNIYMEYVKNPFVINMYYYCDSDGKSEYVQSKDKNVIDSRTPFLGSFTFEKIECHNTLISGSFFYGLPERPIECIKMENVKIDFIDSDLEEYPAMMCDIEKVKRQGLLFKNVRKIILKNVKVIGAKDPKYIIENNEEYSEE